MAGLDWSHVNGILTSGQLSSLTCSLSFDFTDHRSTTMVIYLIIRDDSILNSPDEFQKPLAFKIPSIWPLPCLQNILISFFLL